MSNGGSGVSAALAGAVANGRGARGAAALPGRGGYLHGRGGLDAARGGR
jgi:hypothetical protein